MQVCGSGVREGGVVVGGVYRREAANDASSSSSSSSFELLVRDRDATEMDRY